MKMGRLTCSYTWKATQTETGMARARLLPRGFEVSHAVQWHRVNWGELISSVYGVGMRYAKQRKRENGKRDTSSRMAG